MLPDLVIDEVGEDHYLPKHHIMVLRTCNKPLLALAMAQASPGTLCAGLPSKRATVCACNWAARPLPGVVVAVQSAPANVPSTGTRPPGPRSHPLPATGPLAAPCESRMLAPTLAPTSWM